MFSKNAINLAKQLISKNIYHYASVDIKWSIQVNLALLFLTCGGLNE